jgi:hypothetical protein
MKKQLLVLVLSMSMAVAATGVAQADLGPDLTPRRAMEWRLIQYFGSDAYGQLDWYWQLTLASGVGVGCGFIGMGVGILNPFAGFFASSACDTGIMA